MHKILKKDGGVMGASNKTGVVFDVQRFCVNDGAGIRTIIFFKGCPLHCKWCHNPESQKMAPQLRFKAVRCVACGLCADVCPEGVHAFLEGQHVLNFEKCQKCGKCISYCCYDALELCGKNVSVAEILETVLIDKPYYKTDGGVTLSGGEPMMQADFVREISAQLQQQGVSVYMETCGYAPLSDCEKVLPYIDCFMLDWKISDPQLHKEMTGVSNEKILETLSYLNSKKKKVILRCPIIPDVNLNSAHFKHIAYLQKAYPCIDHVELLAYHSMGETKKLQIGRQDVFEATVPTKEDTERWLAELRSYGCTNAIIG